MTRTLDRTIPPVTRHPIAPGAPIEDWAYRPVIALEQVPQALYAWDDPDPAVVWDATGPGTAAYLNPTVGTVTTPAPADDPAGQKRVTAEPPATATAYTLSGGIARIGTGTTTPMHWHQYEAINRAQLVFPGVTGNYLSTPDLTAWAGDIEIVVRCAFANAVAATYEPIVADRGTAVEFLLRRPTGVRRLELVWTDNTSGTVYTPRSATDFPAGNGVLAWYRVRLTAATGIVTFEHAADSPTEPTTWTTLGSGTSVANTTRRATATPWTIGHDNSAYFMKGRIARVIVRNGIAGTTVLDVSENNAGTMATSTTFLATTGQTVTVAQTAGNTIVQPQADAVVWRFDADDYPGTGTSYVDPRGRTWTLSTAGAIVPEVPGDPLYVWDEPAVTGWVDAVCDFMVADINPGEPDDLYLFPPAELTLTLHNPTGAYTPWTSDGRLAYWAPGRRVAIWAHRLADGTDWWLFGGRVASWQVNPDDTVTITAFDGLAWLAQEVGGDWTPGAAGDTPAARITAAAAAVAYPDPLRLDVGNVHLTTAPVDRAPLEVVEVAALSDGGLFYGDADGTLLYRDRLWRAGRDDQPQTWVVSDNVCTVPVVVWDPVMASDDERLATDVRLVNVAALVATATATGSLWQGDARYVLAHPQPDEWTTQAEGDALAAYLLAQQSTPSMALRSFDVHALSPNDPALFDLAVLARRGDLFEVLHDYPDAGGTTSTLDVYAVCLTIAHSITPESWVSSFSLSRTVDYRLVEHWDRTVFTWDDPDPLNVWRF